MITYIILVKRLKAAASEGLAVASVAYSHNA